MSWAGRLKSSAPVPPGPRPPPAGPAGPLPPTASAPGPRVIALTSLADLLANLTAQLAAGDKALVSPADGSEKKLVRPRGMANRRNNCFLNAVVQSMLSCQSFHCVLKQFSKDGKELCKKFYRKESVYCHCFLSLLEDLYPEDKEEEFSETESKDGDPEAKSIALDSEEIKSEIVEDEELAAAIEKEDEADFEVVVTKKKPKARSKKKSKKGVPLSTKPAGSTGKSATSEGYSSSSSAASFASASSSKRTPSADTSLFTASMETLLSSFIASQGIGSRDYGGGPGSQEDAQEFLQYVLDKFHQELLDLKKKQSVAPPTLTLSKKASSTDSVSTDEWKEVGAGNRVRVVQAELRFELSLISLLFGCRIRIVVSRHSAGKDSVSFQPLFALPLELKNFRGEEISSLEDAIREFQEPTEISGLKSEKTSKVVRGSRIAAIDEIGQVLVFQLKRFDYGEYGLTKISRHVSFPEVLSLEISSSGSKKGSGQTVKLILSSVVAHHGASATRGHYTSFVRSPNRKVWWHVDDHLRKRVSLDDVLSQQAYLLFYERC